MEDKKGYTERIEQLLRADPRSDIKECGYTKEDEKEVVYLIYNSGYSVLINVNCNSLGAILTEVVREVYNNGATGTYYRGFPDEEATA